MERNGERVFIDCSDEFRSNWMGFIRPARSYSEQNLMAFCNQNEIYFATIKTIEPRQELKVWYAKSFAESLGERILEITPEEVAGEFLVFLLACRSILFSCQDKVFW